MYIAKIYLILLSTLIHIAGCIDDKFWLTTELMRFEWSRGCTATKYCTRPQLRLTEQNLINGETLAVNWLFSEDVVTVNKLFFLPNKCKKTKTKKKEFIRPNFFF